MFVLCSSLQNVFVEQHVATAKEFLAATMPLRQNAVTRCRLLRSSRFLFFTFSVLMILAYTTFYSGYQVNVIDHEQSSLYDAPNDLIRTPSCRIPDFDPFDPLVLQRFLAQPVTRCPRTPPFFIKAKVHGVYSVAHLDETILWKHYRLKRQNIRCKYQIAIRDDRISTPDMDFRLVNETSLKFGEFIDGEYIWIECFRYAFKNKFYTQPLLLARAKDEDEFEQSFPEQRPHNVIVLGYDSVSRLNFHRQMRKTKAFLDARPNTVTELLGYNKVGLNSGPSQIPLLSGHRFRPRGLYETVRKNYVDNMTRYIWADFKEAGYSTMFFEEQWNYGLFVWPEMKGFLNQPTDYWPRPIIQIIDGSSVKLKNGGGICIGPRPAAAVYLDYVLDLLRTSRKPMWMYPWFSELSHNDLTGASRADDLFLDFFMAMENEGFLNETIIFFISDHGFRFGDLRHTPLGRYEDQLPFGYVMVPPSFAEQRPAAMWNLKVNARRLLTTYDMHATMMEIATSSAGQRITRTKHGYSLFSERIPLNRTCASAQIDFEFCSCYGVANHRVDPAFSVRLGELVVKEINDELDRNNDKKCLRWKLGTVSQALPLMEGTRQMNVYRVSVDTVPSGKFEATIAIQPNSGNRLKLLSGIDRTDWFSTHAHCAMPSSYERFCYCK